MSLGRRLARQLRQPSGLVGRLTGIVLNRGNRRINKLAVEELSIGPEHRVLEIGFGGGVGLASVLRLTRATVAAVEISATMLDRAHHRFRPEVDEGRLDLREASVNQLPYKDDTFDRILTVNTVYFWPDPAEGLSEIKRVLRPGGRLVIGTITKEVMDKHSFTQYGFSKFSDEQLRQLLLNAGYCDVVVKRYGPRLISAATASPPLSNFIGSEQEGRS